MEIVVNGELVQVDPGMAVSQLLVHLGVQSRAVAVEINGEIQPLAEFEQRVVQPGDRLEIVTLVGGG